MSVNQNDNTYVFDAESSAEMARLIEQERFITRAMGALVPPDLDLTQVDTILDLACGPGGWAQEVAFAHQKVEVTGVDISRRMIEYARTLTRAQKLENLQFQLMDVTGPLDFPDNSFDFINARLLVGFMPRDGWSRLIKECWRITRPGGLLRFTESDVLAASNSLALETMNRLIARAMHLAGRSLSPDGHDTGVLPMLPYFFRQAGYQNMRKQAFVLDFSQGAAAYNSQYENLKIALLLLQAFVVKMGVTTNEEWKDLYEHALTDMLADDFCALWYFLSVWGEKPLDEPAC